MKTKVFIAATVAFTIGILLTSCVQPKKNEATSSIHSMQRDVAQISNLSTDEELDVKVNALLDNPSASSKVISTELDKLFVLLVRSYSYIEEFNLELDDMLKRQKEDSNATNLDPLQTEAYKKLIKTWILKEKYEHQLVAFYQAGLTHSSFSNESLNPNAGLRIKNARMVVNTINQYLSRVDILQQVELQNLMKEVQATYRKNVKDYKINILSKETSKIKLKEISSISDSVIFDHKIVTDSKRLSILAKKSQEKNSPQRAAFTAKYFTYIDEIDKELGEIAGPTFDQRQPNALPPQKLSCEPGKKICISTGEDGNIVGKIFPPGVFTFTFDDGPDPVHTEKIMDLFLKYKDKINPRGQATFFWTAAHAEQNESLVAKALKNDFPVENHSYNHADLSKQDKAGRIKQIITSNTILETIARKYEPGYTIRYFRCPYGSCYAPAIPEIRQMLVNQKQIHVYWRIDSLDWKLMNGPATADLVIKQMKLKGNGVVLMHDIHGPTVDATKIVLDWLKKSNDSGATQIKLLTIPQAVDLVNGK